MFEKKIKVLAGPLYVYILQGHRIESHVGVFESCLTFN